jgi:hypothetical protein
MRAIGQARDGRNPEQDKSPAGPRNRRAWLRRLGDSRQIATGILAAVIRLFNDDFPTGQRRRNRIADTGYEIDHRISALSSSFASAEMRAMEVALVGPTALSASKTALREASNP